MQDLAATHFQSVTKQPGDVNKEPEISERIRAEFGRRIHDLETQLYVKNLQLKANVNVNSQRGNITNHMKLEWKHKKHAPIRMRHFCDTVVDENKVYCRLGDTRSIYVYESSNENLVSTSRLGKTLPTHANRA